MKGKVMSNADYRRAEGISSSELKKIAVSPMHYKYWKENPQERTPALLFGAAAHKYMLEKNDFDKEFIVAPNCDRRTKEGKAVWQSFVDTSNGKEVITQDDMDKIKGMYDALYSTPFVSKLLSGSKELSYFATDEHTELAIKARPDCLTKIGDTIVLIDYKSCESADTDKFMRDAIKYKYDLQAYHYLYVLKLNGIDVNSVIFISQEKTPPYAVNILEANPQFMASGKDMYETYINIFKECSNSGDWYGYVNNEVNSLGLPAWLQKIYEKES